MWKATYQRDTELLEVGSIVATWTDPLDSTNTFTFGPTRVDSKNSLAAFVSAAKAALAASRQKANQVNVISAKVTAALNA